jgi:hypothetical protein
MFNHEPHDGSTDSVTVAAKENSSLVKKTTAASLGLGLTYTWLRSERSLLDRGRVRKDVWADGRA